MKRLLRTLLAIAMSVAILALTLGLVALLEYEISG
jgi:hypothetical protein